MSAWVRLPSPAVLVGLYWAALIVALVAFTERHPGVPRVAILAGVLVPLLLFALKRRLGLTRRPGLVSRTALRHGLLTIAVGSLCLLPLMGLLEHWEMERGNSAPGGWARGAVVQLVWFLPALFLGGLRSWQRANAPREPEPLEPAEKRSSSFGDG